ncbi:RYamide neuropeptides-like [Trichoplusia ni]|uniref:RYamide neuropeptides-like n=1 Tax=Trichoplusia ni TaxID=7111 RepID=A0A7E5WXN7_TRINI|nr:RYamide neuropeptides-like [Trichoplusia ni]XP_026745274.1 RYamide neuropeptides-like [Trichoplusia ni]
MCVRYGYWCRGCACALLLLLAIAAAQEDKRAEMSPMPFLMATRYGRSSAPRHLAPRNDRFFMSSRYGKRSGVSLGGERALLCEFTGVFPLYRCRHKLSRYDKRSTEEAVRDE